MHKSSHPVMFLGAWLFGKFVLAVSLMRLLLLTFRSVNTSESRQAWKEVQIREIIKQ